MQRRGLVEREECQTDRRGATFRLTSTGRTTIEQAAPGHVEAVRTLVFDALSSRQVTQLADRTGHLLHHLEAGRPAGPGKGPQQPDSAGQRVV